MDVAEYFDATAPFYDDHYGELPDVDFYRELAGAAEGPVLEVGCGTGRIYLELLADGVDADGIDVSTAMLAELRRTAEERGLEPRVREADVRTFEPDRRYALAIVPFRAFLHLTTVEDQLAALERLHHALEPGGQLVVSAFVPNFRVIADRYGEWDETELEREDGIYRYRMKTELVDEVRMIARIEAEVRGPDGNVIASSASPIALITVPQFDLLFRCSPFVEWSVQGDFAGEELVDASQEQVWFARAAPDTAG